MSSRSWPRLARTALSQSRPAERPPRVAVVGVGNPLAGDDAVGSLVAESLKRRLGAQPSWLIADGATAPENYVGKLRAFAPDLVVFVDAAELNDRPGAARWRRLAAVAGCGADTHGLPLSVLGEYLAAELGCDVALLGIQPGQTDFCAPPSPHIRRRARDIARRLAGLLRDHVAASSGQDDI